MLAQRAEVTITDRNWWFVIRVDGRRRRSKDVSVDNVIDWTASCGARILLY